MFSFEERYTDDRYYASDSLNNGRSVKQIFYDLSDAMMNMAEEHGKQHIDIYDELDYPFFYSEEKVGWMLPTFFKKEGYLVWSEWTEENIAKDNGKKSHRKIDFLVAKKGLDLFIELKRISGCVDGDSILYSVSHEKLVSQKKPGSGLLDQVYNMKEITPDYNENKVLAGIIIVNSSMKVSGYSDSSCESFKSGYKKVARKLVDEINDDIDGRRNMHLIANHAVVNWDNNGIKKFREDNDLRFLPMMLSIVGVFCSPKS